MRRAKLRKDTGTGLAAGTGIATLDGMRPIETLSAGDRVVTHDGGARRVLWAGPVPAETRLVHIPEGAMDNDADIRVAPGQRLMWAGWQAELLFGTGEVLVEAGDLIGMNGIGWAGTAGTRDAWHLVVAGCDMVLAGGTWGASHAFAPGADRATDSIADRAPRPVLSPSEAEVLVSYGAYRPRPAATVRAPLQLRLVA